MENDVEESQLQRGISMKIIEVQNLTKDYGNHRGIFDLNFVVEQGEVVGFLGSNGAGKTTTIRILMGFIHSQQGMSKIFNMDTFFSAKQIQSEVGYLPGELSFLDDRMTGNEFIQFMMETKGSVQKERVHYLLDYFELDAHIKIKKMSKGTKQKLGLVIAFMHEPSVLILDEPTSGLDPIMQNKFVELIKSEKHKGKTIFMSSHIFEEVENTCDRILMVKDGNLVADKDIQDIRDVNKKHYTITFASSEYAKNFAQIHVGSRFDGDCRVSFFLDHTVNSLLRELVHYDVQDIAIRNQTIEEVFLQYYGGEKK